MGSCIGIFGARGLVGQQLVRQAHARGLDPVLVSRRPPEVTTAAHRWVLPREPLADVGTWISAVPIWLLPHYFDWIAAAGVRRLVAMSSTSRYTKIHSKNPDDYEISNLLARGEHAAEQWAEQHGVDLVILRPTLIYGDGLDQNICDIVRVVRRFSFFPLVGEGKGLRQPIHTADVGAAALKAALDSPSTGAFNIVGGETLTYRTMLERIFVALNRRPVLPILPKALVAAAIFTASRLPRYSHWTLSMAERTDEDMVFDDAAARALLGISPRHFQLTSSDLPVR